MDIYTNLNEQLEMETMARVVELEARILMDRLRLLLPIKTGNLRNNSFRMVKTAEGFDLFLDEMIAPYIKYPNLQKKLDVIWPQLVEQFTLELAAALNGSVE
jgi:hypothetical protein